MPYTCTMDCFDDDVTDDATDHESIGRPITFSSASKADTLITVFGQDFHVHSYLLKHHSAFFRIFLDSPDKMFALISTKAAFKYEWVTRLDDDGKDWSLVCISSITTKDTPSTYEGIKRHIQRRDILCFEILLKCIYCQPILLRTPGQLIRATRLADYYRILPSLSNGIDSAFHRSKAFISCISECPLELLEVACKLRNETLYKSCMILVMGPWSKPAYEQVKDDRLKRIAGSAHHRLVRKLTHVRTELMEILATCFDTEAEAYRAIEKEEINFLLNFLGKISMPALYRRFSSRIRELEPSIVREEIQLVLARMLKNELPLEPYAKAGKHRYGDHFLCLELGPEDLPWDVEEREW